ncbi:MAG: hypothetical protein KC455_10210, partial [Carnobacterium sp.]|nr:hypothetical protein [Carnobacterium sp.]
MYYYLEVQKKIIKLLSKNKNKINRQKIVTFVLLTMFVLQLVLPAGIVVAATSSGENYDSTVVEMQAKNNASTNKSDGITESSESLSNTPNLENEAVKEAAKAAEGKANVDSAAKAAEDKANADSAAKAAEDKANADSAVKAAEDKAKAEEEAKAKEKEGIKDPE